jgi:hypothetical protein
MTGKLLELLHCYAILFPNELQEQEHVTKFGNITKKQLKLQLNFYSADATKPFRQKLTHSYRSKTNKWKNTGRRFLQPTQDDQL